MNELICKKCGENLDLAGAQIRYMIWHGKKLTFCPKCGTLIDELINNETKS